MLSTTTSELLYVPFNDDYTVNKTIREKLTEEEFFEHCFVKPILANSGETTPVSESETEYDDIDDSRDTTDKELNKSIRLVNYNNYRTDHNNFMRWIENDGHAVYCVMGEAGSGKTTYLRWLQYHYRNQNINWEIINIQESKKELAVLNQEYTISNHERLIYKAISCMIREISNRIFNKGLNKRQYLPFMTKNLERIYSNYKEHIAEEIPKESIAVFFDNSTVFNKNANQMTREDLKEFAKSIVDYLDTLLKQDEYTALRRLWRVYCTVLRSENPDAKYVIAFDNIERFIGVDEICNSQLNKFVEYLRLLNDNDYGLDEAGRTQTVVFMRNTSERMSNLPLQRIDFGGHEIDITGWFPVEEVIKNKIKWFEDNSITVDRVNRIKSILSDTGHPAKSYRSLHTKLNMLFNYDKRVIIQLLDRALNPKAEDDDLVVTKRKTKLIPKKDILAELDTYMKQAEEKNSIFRYATRSIVTRLLLDTLREDEFFKNIHVTDHETDHDEMNNKRIRLGYSRELLLVLYNYQLEGNNEYMPFDTLMTIVLNSRRGGTIERFFDENQRNVRLIISEILYYMNYYNTRRGDWLHLVDVQYNTSEADHGLHVSNYHDMDEIIKEDHKNIGVKITQAGIAYLHFIVHTFEYFSCRVIDHETPPLMASIPSIEQLNAVDDYTKLQCVVTINCVQRDAVRCILRMRERPSSTSIKYRHINSRTELTHEERIFAAHKSHIDIFRELLEFDTDKDQLSKTGKKTYRELKQFLARASKDYNGKLVEQIQSEARQQ